MKKYLRNILYVAIIANLYLLSSCTTKTNIIASDSEIEENVPEKEVEYEVYKKIDFSEFVDRKVEGLNEGLISHVDGSIYLAPAPCKITVKASVKIEKGPGLQISDLNDNFAVGVTLGPISDYVYFADYEDNFFDEFHEIERAEEYYYGISSGVGYVYFPNIGLFSLSGSPGWKEKNVSNNETEYVGDFLTQDKSKTKLRVTIKDIYYKISKPTGVESDWEFNHDFEYYSYEGIHAYAMKKLDDGYTYILKPRFTFNINEKYEQNAAVYLDCFYVTDDNKLVQCASFRNGRETDIRAKYNKIALGIRANKFRYAGKGEFLKNVNLSWDKNSGTLIVSDSAGEVVATIKMDFVKEYKYKSCEENDTPGYRRYVAAHKKSDVN